MPSYKKNDRSNHLVQDPYLDEINSSVSLKPRSGVYRGKACGQHAVGTQRHPLPGERLVLAA